MHKKQGKEQPGLFIQLFWGLPERKALLPLSARVLGVTWGGDRASLAASGLAQLTGEMV